MPKVKNRWRPRSSGHKPVRTQAVFLGVLDERDGLEKRIHDIEGKYGVSNPALARLLCRELRRALVRLVEK